ncbi:unknown protein [Seminavis robusta]|uniref:Uncharacterized protein n=1 Tax=Seminavis robusta TaxID=568900 RepID=A0A9N8EZH5_9STRA|nr:unknown protein [Seminavis robusta]|eukprot:Sro2680_g334470.1 n/a (264) ;mRNA; r:9260-10051
MSSDTDAKLSDEEALLLVVAHRAEEAARQLRPPANSQPGEDAEKTGEAQGGETDEEEDNLMDIVAKRADNARQEILIDESENQDSASKANEAAEDTVEKTLDGETPGDEKVETEDDLMDIVAKRADNARQEIMMQEELSQEQNQKAPDLSCSQTSGTVEDISEETSEAEKGLGVQLVQQQEAPEAPQMEVDVPFTNPVRRQQARTPASRPGAYALGPNRPPTQDLEPPMLVEDSSASNSTLSNINDGLVEARMILKIWKPQLQ